MQLPSQMNFSIGVQRELGGGYFVEADLCRQPRRASCIRQPDINRASFDALRANAALPAAQRVSTNSLRPYAGYSAIRMRISDAESNYNSLQLYATKRRGDIQFTVSYTLGKVITNASGNGDNDAPEAVGRSRLPVRPGVASTAATPSSNTLTYRRAVAARSRRRARGDRRRLGGQQQGPLPVGPVLHRHRQLVDRRPARRLHRRRDRHRRRRDSAGSTPRRSPTRRTIARGIGHRRADRGPELQSVGHLDAEELPLRRPLQRHADLRRVQPVRHA